MSSVSVQVSPSGSGVPVAGTIGIQPVDVDGQIDATPASRALNSSASRRRGPLRVPGAHARGVGTHEMRLPQVHRADAELQHLLDAVHLQQPAGDAGVAVGRALVLVAQVAVGVDLDDGEWAAQRLQQAAAKADADSVFAAEPDQELAAGRGRATAAAISSTADRRVCAEAQPGSVWTP